MGHVGKEPREISVRFVFIFCCLLAHGALSQPCKLRKDADSIKVFVCHVDTSKFKSIRAEFLVRCSTSELIRHVTDIAHYPNWQFNTAKASIIKIVHSNEIIYHTYIDAPWPVEDRDMTVRMKWLVSDSVTIITANSEPELLAQEKDFIRVPFSHSTWTIHPMANGQLRVVYEMLIDPGGHVPAWLVNWVCAQAPYESFRDLRKRIRR